MKLRLYSVLACLTLAAALASGQNAAPAQSPEPAPPKAPETQQPSGKLAPPKEVASPVNSGMGFAFEPIYWKASVLPEVRQGTTYFRIDSGNFKYPNSPVWCPSLPFLLN